MPGTNSSSEASKHPKWRTEPAIHLARSETLGHPYHFAQPSSPMTVEYQIRTTKPLDILLVEDNPGDVRLMLEILKEGEIPHDFNVVTDGEQALQYLRKEAHFTEKARPDIVFLDLNLPKMGGLEVLKAIKADPDLQSIPVVIMTSSDAQEDVERAYADHANCFITKPMDPDEFHKVAEIVRAFWLSAVKLPSGV